MNADTWIAGASGVVALAALGLALLEGRANRRHNRLSVAPRLRLDFEARPETRSVKIVLVNAGLGPAIFDAFEPMLDGQPAAVLGLSTLADVAGRAGVRGKLRYSTVLEGEILTHGGSLELFSVAPGAFEEHPDQDYGAPFRRIGVRVRYHSMYGESSTCEGHGAHFLDGVAPPGPAAGKVAVPSIVRAPAADRGDSPA